MGDVVAEARAASRADAWRYIEPLAAEVERLRSVVAGVEALADGWKRSADGWEHSKPLRYAGRRLRSVLSDTRQEEAQ